VRSLKKRKTAGELSHELASDSTKYDAFEVGHALVEDGSVEKGIMDCIQIHNKIFNVDEYVVGYLIASDPLIKGLMRRKFHAWLWLPKPRPSQAMFLYNKKLDKITKCLWVLPNVIKMENLIGDPFVKPEYKRMQAWSMAFYQGTFFEFVRYESGTDLMSEQEYLKAYGEKLIDTKADDFGISVSDTFDFSKIQTNKVVDPDKPLTN